jgi:hypothetical protein
LNHKVGNDAVKDGSLVVKRLARRARSLFASAKGSKVLDGLGNRVAKKTHNHTASIFRAFDLDIKENLGGDLFAITTECKGTKTRKLAKHTVLLYSLKNARCEHPAISRSSIGCSLAGAFDTYNRNLPLRLDNSKDRQEGKDGNGKKLHG